jgi:hypothetical protein
MNIEDICVGDVVLVRLTEDDTYTIRARVAEIFPLIVIVTVESDDICRDGSTIRVLPSEIIEIAVWAGDDDEHDQFRTDAEADGDALASAGMGTDEDYGNASFDSEGGFDE